MGDDTGNVSGSAVNVKEVATLGTSESATAKNELSVPKVSLLPF